MKKVVGVVVALIVIVGVIGAWLVGAKNHLVTADEAVNAAWANVDTQLQRRSDLIPNLVSTVKGYAKQEQKIFTDIAESRAKLAGARTVPEKIDASRGMDSALARLLVVVEQYPQLKSNQNFIQLQDELAGTENRLTVARRDYNEAVQNYNLTVRTFPTSLAAGWFHFATKDSYFRADEGARGAPKVNFD